MAVFYSGLILRALFLIIAISAVLSAPQQKQTTQVAQKQKVAETTGVARVQDPKCLQPMEKGPCSMNLARFYYNSQLNTCEPFKFGGCRGNDNKFGFLKTCEDACVVPTKPTTNNVVNSKTPASERIPNAPSKTGANQKSVPNPSPATGTISKAAPNPAPSTGTNQKNAPNTPSATGTIPKTAANSAISTTTTTKAPAAAQTQPKATKPNK